ncbi:MAG: nucleotidyl transferase AbiEii/AbiGii toxin family protein [Rectinemataceae bacterium]|nr:nucleotidyl transferase AbiEii/AbiGii toxin family protein [Rectinemataceae bacterium]
MKLEIDTAPPAGARLETKMVTRHLLFGIRHHDLPSLMAGKIRAMLTRPYAKGRDWFDLLWYASQIPAVVPNMMLLASEWRKALAAKLDALDFEALRADVSPFLERREDSAALNEVALRAAIS